MRTFARAFPLLVVAIFFGISGVVAQDDGVSLHHAARLGRGMITAVEWSPNGDLIAVATKIGLWLYTPELESVDYLPMPRGANDVRWSPDGRWLVANAVWYDRALDEQVHEYTVWEYKGGSFRRQLETFLSLSEIEWNSSGSRLALIDHGNFYLFDTTTGRQLLTLQSGHVTSIDWSFEDTQVAVIDDSRIKLFDAREGRLRSVLEGEKNGFDALWWSPDSTRIAARSAGQRDDSDSSVVAIYEARTGNRLARFQPEAVPDPLCCGKRVQDFIREPVGDVAWSPDGQLLAVAYANLSYLSTAHVRLLSMKAREEIADVQTSIWRLEFTWTPDGNQLIILGYGGSGYPQSYTLDLRAGFVLKLLGITSWRVKPDEYILAAFSYSETLHLFDFNTLREQRKFFGNTDNLIDADWRADGHKLVTASPDELQIWDVNTGNLLADEISHLGAWAFVEDWRAETGLIAVSSSTPRARFRQNNTSLRIWNTLTLSSVTSLRGFYAVGDAIWLPGGTFLLTRGYISVFEPNVWQLWDGWSGDLLGTYQRDDLTLTPSAFNDDQTMEIRNNAHESISIYGDSPSDSNERIELFHFAIPNRGLGSSHWHPSLPYTAIMVWDTKALRRNDLYLLNLTSPDGSYQFLMHNVTSFVWNPDGTQFAVSRQEGYVDIYDIEF